MTKAKSQPRPKAKPSLPKVKFADDNDVQPSEAAEDEIPQTEKQAPAPQEQEPPHMSYTPGMSYEETKFKRFRKFEFAEMRPYVEGEDMANIRVGDEDKRLGCPQKGDMICRNVTNHDDQWLLSGQAFRLNFEAFDK